MIEARETMIYSSSQNRLLRALRIRSHRPFYDHLLNLEYTADHDSKSVDRSRQGIPVLNAYRIPFIFGVL